jgi:hypothetical protein
MYSICTLVPRGIDIEGRRQWALARKFGREIRARLEEIKHIHDDPEGFGVVAGAYVEWIEKGFAKDDPPLRYGRAFCRLARMYLHHFRRALASDPEAVARSRFLAAAERMALMGQL